MTNGQKIKVENVLAAARNSSLAIEEVRGIAAVAANYWKVGSLPTPKILADWENDLAKMEQSIRLLRETAREVIGEFK